MTPADRPDALQRRFSVHGTEEVRGRAQMVEGVSFEDAALRFAAEWHGGDAGEASLLIEDCETGEQQCFRIDLGSGDAAPCE
jgi:hypothetical protein